MTIEPIKSFNCRDINIFCLRRKLTFNFPKIIITIYTIIHLIIWNLKNILIPKNFPIVDSKFINKRNIFTKEIRNSTQDYNTNTEDLYVHFRSGDIFTNHISPNYE